MVICLSKYLNFIKLYYCNILCLHISDCIRIKIIGREIREVKKKRYILSKKCNVM